MEELFKNEEENRKYLATYFTNFAEQNWNEAAKGRKSSETNTNPIPQSNNIDNEGVYNLKGDNTWDYKLIGNKWHTRKKGNSGEWRDLTTDAKFKPSIDILNKAFPDAVDSESEPIHWTPTNKNKSTNSNTSAPRTNLVNNRPTGYMGAMK